MTGIRDRLIHVAQGEPRDCLDNCDYGISRASTLMENVLSDIDL